MTEQSTHFSEIGALQKRAKVMGTNTTAPRSPMERKPKSLITGPGTDTAMSAAQSRTTIMVMRVTTRPVLGSSSRRERRLKMSLTRIEATPMERPEPPPTMVMKRVPSTTPPTKEGR